MGRRGPKGKGYELTSVCLLKTQRDRIDEAAKQLYITRSDVIRWALDEWLETHD